MPDTMPNTMPFNISREDASKLLYVFCYLGLCSVNSQEAERFKEFVQRESSIFQQDNPEFSTNVSEAQSHPNQDLIAKQKLIDKAFQYTANSLFLTSVLASGELVGSTIWGISKYVTKDMIWDTLGATTVAIILQSAELIGYRAETEKLLGVDKGEEKTAVFAIKLGGFIGKAAGAVAGTALSLLIESFIIGIIAAALVPFITGSGLFAGILIGEIIGAAIGAGVNNLFFATIGIVPNLIKGTKAVSGKFTERIKYSKRIKSERARDIENSKVNTSDSTQNNIINQTASTKGADTTQERKTGATTLQLLQSNKAANNTTTVVPNEHTVPLDLQNKIMIKKASEPLNVEKPVSGISNDTDNSQQKAPSEKKVDTQTKKEEAIKQPIGQPKRKRSLSMSDLNKTSNILDNGPTNPAQKFLNNPPLDSHTEKVEEKQSKNQGTAQSRS
ncbi:MAG: GlsB/YeaQ/YmgE family stress response membrane protein [Rickettsiaceae bacterium]|nr:GlsB/YeaQ/YmgE family stress response membrane protein [Rickettsiaceae bacterium]